MRLPEVLQVMVVGCRATALDLGEDAPTPFKAEDGVGPNLGRKPNFASKGHLLVEPSSSCSRRATIRCTSPLWAP